MAGISVSPTQPEFQTRLWFPTDSGVAASGGYTFPLCIWTPVFQCKRGRVESKQAGWVGEEESTCSKQHRSLWERRGLGLPGLVFGSPSTSPENGKCGFSSEISSFSNKQLLPSSLTVLGRTPDLAHAGFSSSPSCNLPWLD